MKKLRHWKNYLLIFFFGILCPMLFAGCECKFDFNISNTPKTISAPVIFADTANQTLQWYDLEETDVYDIYINGSIYKTFSIPESQKNGIVEISYADGITSNSKNTLAVVGKNIDRVGYYDSKKSNEIIINLTPAFTKTSKSAYTFTLNKQLTPSAVKNSDNSITISWNNTSGKATYLLRAFSNTNGYVERLIYTTSEMPTASYTLTNIYDHEIVTYNISLITGGSTATTISAQNEYFNPDGNYTILTFDGYLWDYYINSQEELNAIVYYNYLTRNVQYEMTFDTTFINSANNMHNVVDRAFDSFFETSYFDTLKSNNGNYGYVSGNRYIVQIDYDNISECNTNLTVNTQYLYKSIDMGTQYYENVDYEKRLSTYDDFVSDDYLLTDIVTKSEQLYTAIENKITPKVIAGSRAEQIYTKAKEVLREIISDEMTDYEKALSIFDWITYNTVYDYSGSYKDKTYNFTQDCCYYLEGVFLKGVAVCDGFSKAFSMLCNMEGIDCIRIVGTASTGSGQGGHAWNKVKIDGEYYVVDITWTEIINSSTEYLSHKYFLTSEQAISATHTPFANREKFYMYPTKIESSINYYNQVNYYYEDQSGIFFDDTANKYNNKVGITQYIDSSEDLRNALYLPVLNNSRFIEMVIDYDYMLDLFEKDTNGSETLIEALQYELRAVKFSPQLISQIYDSSYGTINFMPYADGKYGMVCIFDTTLLVNEPNEDEENELFDILEKFGKYANYNPDVLYSATDNTESGYEIEVGFDASYLQSELGLTERVDTVKDFKKYFAQYMSSFADQYQVKCNYTYEFTDLTEDTKINNNQTPTKIFYVLFKITEAWSEPIASPNINISDNNTLTWNAVANAIEYQIYVNEEYLTTIDCVSGQTTYTFNLSEVLEDADSYTIQVRAIANNLNYSDSEFSNAITYIIPSTPDVNINGTTISWTWQDGVTSYIVKEADVDKFIITKSGTNYILQNSSNSILATLTTTSFNLADYISTAGNHNFTMHAVVDNNTQSNVVGRESSSFGYYQLATPEISFDGTLLQWQNITNANSYSIKYRSTNASTYTTITNADVGTNGNNKVFDIVSLNLVANEYIIYIQAINNNSGYNSSESSNQVTYVKLDTPNIHFSDSNNSSLLTWSDVADTYILCINGSAHSTPLSTNSIDLSTIIENAGTYTINVQSTSNQSTLYYAYESSESSNIVTYVKLNAPKINFDYSTGTTFLLWANISDSYILNINNSPYSTLLTTNAIDLSTIIENAGTYTISIQSTSTQSTLYYSYQSSELSNTVTYVKLGAPNIAFNNTNNTSLLSWTKVNVEDSYILYINGSAHNTPLSTNSIDLSTIIENAGTNTINVQSTSNQSTLYYAYESSKSSNTVYYTVLDKPQITLNGNTISWSAITNAKKYYIYQDSSLIATITDNLTTYSYDLSTLNLNDGTYSFYIIASLNESNLTSNGYKTATSNSVDYVVKTDVQETLSTPVVTDIDFSTETITWDTVMNANGYKLYLDNILIASPTTNSYTFASKIHDNSIHELYVIATDSTATYANSSNSETAYFQRSSNDIMEVKNYQIYSNSVLDPEVTISDSVLSWNAVKYADSYIAILYCDKPETYFINLNKATSYNLNNLYSTYSIDTNEILAYKIIASVDGKYYATDFDTDYYNPYTGTYNTVYAFDGELNDYNITSQDELNNIFYYAFISRLTSFTFKTTSTIANSYTSYRSTAINSFAETCNLSYGSSVSGTTITQYFTYIGGTTIDKDYYSNLTSAQLAYIYEQKSFGLEFYETYSYPNGRRTDSSVLYDDFATDNGLVRLEVSTSEELYFAIENDFVPVCETGSMAEKIYNLAKDTLRYIVSSEMTDYQKALSIFDWITSNSSYDYYSFQVNQSTAYLTMPCYYLEGVFIYGIAVCDGFSKAYSLLCNMEGLDCIRIVGQASSSGDSGSYGGHAWNKVKVDGNYYLVDITWTDYMYDTTVNNVTTLNEILSHSYFLVSDSMTSITHKPHANRTKFSEYATPTTDYNYYSNTVYSDSAMSQDLSIASNTELDKILDISANKGMKYIEIFVDYSYMSGILANSGTSSVVNALLNQCVNYANGNILSNLGIAMYSYYLNTSIRGYIVYLTLTYR